MSSLIKANHTWIVVSAKSARALFEGCTTSFITNVCHGRCCLIGRGGKFHTSVPVTMVEAKRLSRFPVVIKSCRYCQVLQPTDNGRCYFHDQGTGFCALHCKLYRGVSIKPSSCFISPWNLTRGGRLVIAWRYRALKCHKVPKGIPAYDAFAKGLDIIFGAERAAEIRKHLNDGGADVGGWVADDMVAFLRSRSKQWNR